MTVHFTTYQNLIIHMPDSDSSESGILLKELRRQSEEREERHQERIQILVALSLFAGYITAFFNNLFNNVVLNVATTVLFGVILVFLLYKLILNSHVTNNDLITSDKVDRVFSGLYLFSVVGFAVVAVFIITAEQLNISIQDIGSGTIGSILVASMFLLMIILFTFIGKKQNQNLRNQEKRLREELPAALKLLEMGDMLDSSKRSALIERLEALLEEDKEKIPDLFWFGSLMMAMEPDGFVSLNHSDRSRLLTIVERVARRDKHGRHDEEDLEKIEAIIERAEESERSVSL
ncbi:hypothetical protein BN903_6 [Halorubrum sp. AJ67]|nr:hypothetical protein BN903_6 [Halorubrum sp. AJ67]